MSEQEDLAHKLLCLLEKTRCSMNARRLTGESIDGQQASAIYRDAILPLIEAELESERLRAVNADPATVAGDLEAAIAEFRKALPGWWFTVGYCSLSRDASCGPDGRVLSPYPAQFDSGFHCDDCDPDSTLASSLRDVMRQALEAAAKELVDG